MKYWVEVADNLHRTPLGTLFWVPSGNNKIGFRKKFNTADKVVEALFKYGSKSTNCIYRICASDGYRSEGRTIADWFEFGELLNNGNWA